MSDFSQRIHNDANCSKVAYALTWENTSPDDYWLPLPNDATYPGLAQMYSGDEVAFADDYRWKNLSKIFGYS